MRTARGEKRAAERRTEKLELEKALEKQRVERDEEFVKEMKNREARVALDVERAKMVIKKEKERRKRRERERGEEQFVGKRF